MLWNTPCLYSGWPNGTTSLHLLPRLLSANCCNKHNEKGQLWSVTKPVASAIFLLTFTNFLHAHKRNLLQKPSLLSSQVPPCQGNAILKTKKNGVCAENCTGLRKNLTGVLKNICLAMIHTWFWTIGFPSPYDIECMWETEEQEENKEFSISSEPLRSTLDPLNHAPHTPNIGKIAAFVWLYRHARSDWFWDLVHAARKKVGRAGFLSSTWRRCRQAHNNLNKVTDELCDSARIWTSKF